MTTLKEFAQSYQPTTIKTFNVADLPKISTAAEFKEKQATKKDGTIFKYFYVEVEGAEYRVPKTVIESVQNILKFKPDLEYFRVKKSGTNKDDTKYKVEPVL